VRNRRRITAWALFMAASTTLAFAFQQAQELKSTGRRSNEPPVPAQGKLGQDLFIAIDHRDVSAVRELLKQGANPNSMNGLEFRPLYIAAASYQMDVMAELLNAGANPDAKSTYGTPLTFAAITGNIAGAKMLLDRGANVNTIRSDGISVLMQASKAGNPALVEELLKRKADVNVKDDGGETALSFAAGPGNTEVGRRLIAAGAKVDTSDAEGLTPLMIASMNGHADFVKMLLEKGAKPNAKDSAGRTALVLAARYGDYPDVVKALINGGANAKAKDVNGSTPGTIAARRGYSGCAMALGNPTTDVVHRTSREAVKMSLQRLQASMLTFTQSATCVSCHHEGLGRMTTAEARIRGFAIDPEVQKVQMERLRGLLAMAKPLHQGALANPEVMKQVPLIEMNEVNTTYTWLLAGLAAHKEPATDATAAMTMVLARQQSPAGCWTFSLPRIPMQSSVFTFTALAVKNLQDYGPKDQASEVNERIARAKSWLLQTDAKSGEDRAWRLIGLKWCGASEDDIAKAAGAIIADQHNDGGWSQTPDLNSDSYATGEALYALHFGGGMPSTDKVYKRGVGFLLRTQDEDGTWYVSKLAISANNYFDAGFPHGESQFASFNGTC